MNLRQILQQYGFLIYPLLVFGLPVLARVFKTLSEQSQKRRAEIERERRLLEALRTGQPVPEPVAVKTPPKRAGRESLEELAAKRRAELARQRTAAQTNRPQRGAGTQARPTPVGGGRAEASGGRDLPRSQGTPQSPGRMGVPSEVSRSPGELTMPAERSTSEPRQPQAPSRGRAAASAPQELPRQPQPPRGAQAGRGRQQPGAGAPARSAAPAQTRDAFAVPGAARPIVDPFAINRDVHSDAPRGVHRGTDAAVAPASARPGLGGGTVVVSLGRSKAELRRAWLMSEVFGPPAAMREPLA